MKKTLAALASLIAVMALNACSTTPAAEVQAGSGAPSQSSSAAPSSTAPSSTPSATTETSAQETAVTITAGDQTFNATINDSQVSRDFLATLPTSLSWERNAGIEYITELPAPLTETGPFYTDVEAGDIVYYNPMDSITIIYAPTSSVPTLTKMGEVTSDLAAFENLPDNTDMRIERS
jgi:hypothetical protein